MAPAVRPVQLRVFGPVAAREPSGAIEFARARERSVLATVACRAVLINRLPDAQGADGPSVRANEALLMHVHRLLGGARRVGGRESRIQDSQQRQAGKVPPSAGTDQPKGPDGKTQDLDDLISDSCQLLTLLWEIRQQRGQWPRRCDLERGRQQLRADPGGQGRPVRLTAQRGIRHQRHVPASKCSTPCSLRTVSGGISLPSKASAGA
jgi:hypothetical protein